MSWSVTHSAARIVLMSSSAVQDILQRIQMLPAADRAVLEERLADLLQAEWLREATEARSLARERGLTQADIDAAVRDVRHAR